MKKIHIICILSVFLSCARFLDVKPRDTKMLKNIEDYRDLLAPYMAFLKSHDNYVWVWDTYHSGPWAPCISALLPGYIGEIRHTRDYNRQTGELSDTYKEFYAWKDQSTKVMWDKLYKLIGPLNMIIGELPHAFRNYQRKGH